MSKASGPLLSVVLPACDEAENIEATVSSVLAACQGLGETFEVILVDDGSRDGTSAKIRALAGQQAMVAAIHHRNRLGYGAALRAGFRRARGTYILFADTDGQYRYEQIATLLAAVRGQDMVIGRRQGRHDPLHRLLVSWVFNRLAGAVLKVNVRDINCGLKIFRRDILDTVQLQSDGFLIDAELLFKAQASGRRWTEVTVEHRRRRRGRSKTRLLDVPEVLASMLRLWRRAR